MGKFVCRAACAYDFPSPLDDYCAGDARNIIRVHVKKELFFAVIAHLRNKRSTVRIHDRTQYS